MSIVHIVAGGQFGSEGKGAFTAALTKLTRPDVLVRVAGPNAGHTAYDNRGQKWSLRQIPVGAVVDHESKLIIGQGSEIDPEVLLEEIDMLEKAGIPIAERLMVDYNATIIEPHHLQRERDELETGSTKKGVGAARADRIMRSAARVSDYGLDFCTLGDTVQWMLNFKYNPTTGQELRIVIEGTQGYGLGLHTEWYPQCTSSNTRPGDFLAMTGLQPTDAERIIPWLVFRTHPIRIAGNSGNLANETTWEEIGQEVEFTTVTKMPRRVGLWDQALATEAIRNCGGRAVRPVLQFLDYIQPDLAGLNEWTSDLGETVRDLEQQYGFPILYVGTGPQTGVWKPAMASAYGPGEWIK